MNGSDIGLKRIYDFAVKGRLMGKIPRYCVGLSLCEYYNAQLKESAFPKFAYMYLMPVYSLPNTEIVGDCLYGPTLCDNFKKCFRANHLLENVIIGVRL